MLDDFMTRAFIAGLGLALVSAPLDVCSFGAWLISAMQPMLQCSE